MPLAFFSSFSITAWRGCALIQDSTSSSVALRILISTTFPFIRLIFSATYQYVRPLETTRLTNCLLIDCHPHSASLILASRCSTHFCNFIFRQKLQRVQIRSTTIDNSPEMETSSRLSLNGHVSEPETARLVE